MKSTDLEVRPVAEGEPFGVAIVGMAGRFPGAPTVRELWARLVAGEECLRHYSTEELLAAGLDRDLVERPAYVKVRGEVAGADQFDAPFFGIPPREAELMDPQHRLLLECAWEALEDAGYDPGALPGDVDVGVFAGEALDTYLLLNVLPEIRGAFSAGTLQAALGNDKDSLTTLIAYHLDLRGPAITIQTSSSTSLVAVCVACQSLLTCQCDMALAGGVSLGSPLVCGYLAEEGGITSPDGHCRAFDARGSGFVPGNGLGLVVLKRVADAQAHGDHIYAVIRGFAVNNDGRRKLSYTAPSVDAHARVITEAQALAGLAPEDITYIEAHGTGTRLGDPVELAALRKSFGRGRAAPGSCAVGSVKTNIGHLDTAAGIAGLIKAALAVHHGLIPASLHCENPNPDLELAGSPFFVNRELRHWRPAGGIRRAGVSSLGMGGTNAHVVLEEAPRPPARPRSSRRSHLFVCSARTQPALLRGLRRLSDFAWNPQGADAADVAFTLCRGRSSFRYRAAAVAGSLEEAADRWSSLAAELDDAPALSGPHPLCFLFPGQGSQYPKMAGDLYRREPVFTSAFDACAEGLREHLGVDLRGVLYGEQAADEEALAATRLCQPALFSVEYALARLWLSWGLRPAAMIGHSLGEWVAATIGGLFELPDALTLVAARARLMDEAEPGGMLAVGLEPAGVEPYLDDEVCLAAVNTPQLCVLSGPRHRLARLREDLAERDIPTRSLRTSHAFHSRSMLTAAEGLRDRFRGVGCGKLRYPLFSTVLGREISEEEAADPEYWCRQILLPVRFADAVRELASRRQCGFLESGPGQTLAGLVRRILGSATAPVVGSLPASRRGMADDRFIFTSLGALWTDGHPVDWEAVYPTAEHRRTPLPTYSFDRIRYWLESRPQHGAISEAPSGGSHVVAARPGKTRPAVSTAYAAAETDRQQRLVEIFEEILGIAEIGLDDDLFELGGHSLMATILVSRVRDTFGVELHLDDVFAAANVRALAVRLGEAAASEALVERLLAESLEASAQ